MTHNAEEVALERVTRGAALLDSHVGNNVPANWRQLIDPDTLDLNSATDCVLGQIFKDASPSYTGYSWALDHIFTTEEQIMYNFVSSYGFATGWGTNDIRVYANDLRTAWVTYLESSGGSTALQRELNRRRSDMQRQIEAQTTKIADTVLMLDQLRSQLNEFADLGI